MGRFPSEESRNFYVSVKDSPVTSGQDFSRIFVSMLSSKSDVKRATALPDKYTARDLNPQPAD